MLTKTSFTILLFSVQYKNKLLGIIAVYALWVGYFSVLCLKKSKKI